jgi:hypothetical protein
LQNPIHAKRPVTADIFDSNSYGSGIRYPIVACLRFGSVEALNVVEHISLCLIARAIQLAAQCARSSTTRRSSPAARQSTSDKLRCAQRPPYDTAREEIDDGR